MDILDNEILYKKAKVREAARNLETVKKELEKLEEKKEKILEDKFNSMMIEANIYGDIGKIYQGLNVKYNKMTKLYYMNGKPCDRINSLKSLLEEITETERLVKDLTFEDFQYQCLYSDTTNKEGKDKERERRNGASKLYCYKVLDRHYVYVGGRWKLVKL